MLGPGGKRGLDLSNLEVRLAPDSRLEGTVKPDQFTAKIESLPPVTSEATVRLEPQRVIVELNSDMLTAKVNAAAVEIPLASSGCRAGAVSMPGAASTPGAR